jgi:hypothetical protein
MESLYRTQPAFHLYVYVNSAPFASILTRYNEYLVLCSPSAVGADPAHTRRSGRRKFDVLGCEVSMGLARSSHPRLDNLQHAGVLVLAIASAQGFLFQRAQPSVSLNIPVTVQVDSGKNHVENSYCLRCHSTPTCPLRHDHFEGRRHQARDGTHSSRICCDTQESSGQSSPNNLSQCPRRREQITGTFRV